MRRVIPIALFVFALTVVPTTTRADDVLLVTGETLQGKVIANDVNVVVLEHPVLGRLTIKAHQVRQVTLTLPEPTAGSTGTETPTKTAAPAPSAPVNRNAPRPSVPASRVAAEPSPAATADGFTLLPNPPVAAWWTPKKNRVKFRAELGVSGTQGDTDSVALNAGLKASQRTNLERWKIAGAYYLTESNSSRTRNDGSIEGNYDLFFPPHDFFPYMQARYDYNEFGEWRSRAAGVVGVGWEIFDTRKIELILRAGAGARRQFGSEDNVLHPEGSFGGEINWIINERQKLSASTSFIPELTDPEDNRVVSAAEWLIKLDEAGTLSFKLGLQNEYRSRTADDSSLNNAKFISAIVLEF